MIEIIAAIYLIGLAFTAGWATQHTDFNAAVIVGALWFLFWPARLLRIFQ